ncbi:Dyp-type peroxidase family [Kitasatospora sp. MAP12-15]|uniref:Dyp-type peroxidase n=1 Tax=unclassified Kitasatospora TaxID=2633591 RepID=UPI0024771736|nr:Dyp-type peroxidase [Kitasatospora sp. MAP12-44]MDH6115049.1 Dyp-type peroxidase family [Kitasatospora sp. MAP12-44]
MSLESTAAAVLPRRTLLAAGAVAGGAVLAPALAATDADAASAPSPSPSPVTAVTFAAGELPLRESEEIQGDILAGFRKDHVQLLLLTFTAPQAARDWLRTLLPQLATTRQVASFNQAFSQQRRTRGGADPAAMSAQWTGLSLTHAGLAVLAGREPLPGAATGGTAEAFRQGPAARAALLGDTGDSAPDNWLFGAPGAAPVHAVLTLAADHPGELAAALEAQRLAAAQADIAITFQQEGAALPGSLAGHEHFGYRDGISQPGVRGFDPLDPDCPDQVQGSPGTRVVPAGEFVVGRPRAVGHPGAVDLPAWMLNGSFQVVRRLAQDVPAWRTQLQTRLATLVAAGVAPADAPPEWLGARLVGRWPSGAPVGACPFADPLPDPGKPADNDLNYADDPQGWATPLFSHVRKGNPRDGLVVQPGARPLAQSAIDVHRIIRRGVPFGPAFDPAFGPAAEAAPDGSATPRGLIFICHQADLVDQFEFLQRLWFDEQDFPPNRTPKPGGDTVIGPDTHVAFETPTGASSSRVTPLDFTRCVRTEGTVYAFSPSLTALRELADGRLDTSPLTHAG